MWYPENVSKLKAALQLDEAKTKLFYYTYQRRITS